MNDYLFGDQFAGSREYNQSVANQWSARQAALQAIPNDDYGVDAMAQQYGPNPDRISPSQFRDRLSGNIPMGTQGKPILNDRRFQRLYLQDPKSAAALYSRATGGDLGRDVQYDQGGGGQPMTYAQAAALEGRQKSRVAAIGEMDKLGSQWGLQNPLEALDIFERTNPTDGMIDLPGRVVVNELTKQPETIPGRKVHLPEELIRQLRYLRSVSAVPVPQSFGRPEVTGSGDRAMIDMKAEASPEYGQMQARRMELVQKQAQAEAERKAAVVSAWRNRPSASPSDSSTWFGGP